MQRLGLEILRRNPYRVLGLLAGATQVEIDAAARRLRIFQTAEDIPGSSNDAGWLGPVPRSGREIEAAVAALADPRTRVESRIWWFCATPVETGGGTGLAGAHDSALGAVARALLTPGDAGRWQTVMQRVGGLATSDAYLAWLAQVEAEGDFEKAATLDESVEAVGVMTKSVATALVTAAEDCVGFEDIDGAGRLLEVLRGCGTDGEGAVRGILDRLEDALQARCGQYAAELERAWNTGSVAILRPACGKVANQFEAMIAPYIRVLCGPAGEEDRGQRARVTGAKLLAMTGDAHCAMQDYVGARRMYARALPLAEGTGLAAAIAKRHEEIEQAAARQRMGVAPARRMPRERGSAPETAAINAQNKAFKVMGSGRIDSGGSWLSAIGPWRLTWVLAIVLVAGLRMCVSMSAGPPAENPSSPAWVDDYNRAHPAAPKVIGN